MVMIQVLIAEVRLNDTDEFGVELGLQDSLLFDRSLVDTIQYDDQYGATKPDQTARHATQRKTSSTRRSTRASISTTASRWATIGSTAALATAVAGRRARACRNFAMGRASPDLGFGGFVFSASSNGVNVLLAGAAGEAAAGSAEPAADHGPRRSAGLHPRGPARADDHRRDARPVRADQQHFVSAGRHHHAGRRRGSAPTAWW